MRGRPLAPSRLVVCLLALSVMPFATAVPVAASPSNGLSPDPVSASTVGPAGDVAVFDGPLLPDAFGPALLPMHGPVPALGARTQPARTPRGVLPLLVSYGLLQALDVHSTLRVLDRGGVERNAMMAPIVNRPAAFIAFKAGMTTATLLAVHRLSTHHRVASYALAIALNSAYAVIVAHNYRVAEQLR